MHKQGSKFSRIIQRIEEKYKNVKKILVLFLLHKLSNRYRRHAHVKRTNWTEWVSDCSAAAALWLDVNEWTEKLKHKLNEFAYLLFIASCFIAYTHKMHLVILYEEYFSW